MASQTSIRFEKLDLLPNVFSVNISNCLFDQTPLSKSNKLFLRINVVTQIWLERDLCEGHGRSFPIFKRFLKLIGCEKVRALDCVLSQMFPE